MKQYDLRNWTISEETEGLLFFAQRMDEILFDYTVDSYKGRMLNSFMLIIEALKTIADIESAKIESAHLKYVIEELNWSLQQDIVVHQLLENEKELFIPISFDENNKDYTLIKNILKLLSNKISPKKYETACRILFKESVKSNKKREINELIDGWICILKVWGYNTKWIHSRVLEYFFNTDNAINSVDQLSVFFDIFNFKKQDFDIYIIVNKGFKTIIEKTKIKHFKVVDLPDKDDDALNKFRKLIKGKQIVVKYSCKTLDEYSAREIALNSIDVLRDLFAFYYHKQKPFRNDITLVVSGEVIYYTKGTSSPLNRSSSDTPFMLAVEKLNTLFEGGVPSEETMAKIHRVFNLHSTSIENRNVDNQLLNLWTAIEVIVPINKKTGGSKIQQIIEIISKSHTLGYPYRIFRNSLSDMISIDRELVKTYIYSLPKEYGNLLEKFVAFLVLDTLQEQRNALFGELNKYPLLRYRLFCINKSFSKPKHILKTLEMHQKKLSWHIRRLYRTRNLIVHDSGTMYDIETLVENCHSYVDEFLKQILRLIQKDNSITTIEQGSSYIDLTYIFKLNLMKENKGDLNENNYLSYLFWK